MRRVARVDRPRPSSLRTYPSARAASRTRRLVSSVTRESSRNARDTVAWETPASRATSWLVTLEALTDSRVYA